MKTKLIPWTLRCLRCRSDKTEPYGERVLCTTCGFTFHETSTDEEDELSRRRSAQAVR